MQSVAAVQAFPADLRLAHTFTVDPVGARQARPVVQSVFALHTAPSASGPEQTLVVPEVRQKRPPAQSPATLHDVPVDFGSRHCFTRGPQTRPVAQSVVAVQAAPLAAGAVHVVTVLVPDFRQMPPPVQSAVVVQPAPVAPASTH